MFKFSSSSATSFFTSYFSPYDSQLLPIQPHLPLQLVMSILQLSWSTLFWLNGKYLAGHATTTPAFLDTFLSQANVIAFYSSTCIGMRTCSIVSSILFFKWTAESQYIVIPFFKCSNLQCISNTLLHITLNITLVNEMEGAGYIYLVGKASGFYIIYLATVSIVILVFMLDAIIVFDNLINGSVLCATCQSTHHA